VQRGKDEKEARDRDAKYQSDMRTLQAESNRKTRENERLAEEKRRKEEENRLAEERQAYIVQQSSKIFP